MAPRKYLCTERQGCYLNQREKKQSNICFTTLLSSWKWKAVHKQRISLSQMIPTEEWIKSRKVSSEAFTNQTANWTIRVYREPSGPGAYMQRAQRSGAENTPSPAAQPRCARRPAALPGLLPGLSHIQRGKGHSNQLVFISVSWLWDVCATASTWQSASPLCPTTTKNP